MDKLIAPFFKNTSVFIYKTEAIKRAISKKPTGMGYTLEVWAIPCDPIRVNHCRVMIGKPDYSVGCVVDIQNSKIRFDFQYILNNTEYFFLGYLHEFF